MSKSDTEQARRRIKTTTRAAATRIGPATEVGHAHLNQQQQQQEYQHKQQNQ